MNRQEICARINEIKDLYGKTWLNLSLATQKNEAVLRNILNGKTNFFLESLFPILTALSAKLIVTKDSQSFDIESVPELTDWIVYTRERSKKTIGQFAVTVGLSRNSVSTYLLGKSKMRVDTFIKWAEVTGYTISIVAPPHRDIRM